MKDFTEIENFKLYEFFEQPQELIDSYMIVLQYVKPCKTEQEVFKMKLKQVEEIKQAFAAIDIELFINVICEVQNLTKDEVANLPIIEFYSILNGIKEQLKVIYKAEENGLTPSRVNFEWEAVGGSERMAKFGIFNTLEMLSGEDITKHEQILNMRYNDVFAILLRKKVVEDLKYEMNEIRKNKK